MCLNDKGQYMYDEGAKMISELIKVNSTLRILDLSGKIKKQTLFT